MARALPSLPRLLSGLACLALALFLVLGAVPTAVEAQAPDSGQTAEVQPPDYEAWQRLATRAEEVVAAERASTEAFGQLRAQLAEWRGRFQTEQTRHTARIATLEAQIEALGPEPEGDAAESEEIAARRAELNEQLAQARAPVLAAEEAYSRADGLIREIDTIVRERQTDQLLRLGPSPLNPASWPAAIGALEKATVGLVEGIVENWANDALAAQRWQNLPVIVALLGAGLVLLLRGRRWFHRASARIVPQGSTSFHRELRWLLTSLSRVVLPMLGLLALTTALEVSQLIGVKAEWLPDTLLKMGLGFFGAQWLGWVIFSTEKSAPRLMYLDEAQAALGHRIATALGVLLALAILLSALLGQPGVADGALLVFGFPVIVVMGVMLYRLGRLLVAEGHAAADVDEGGLFRQRAVTILGRALLGVGVLGPVLAGIGYFNAGGFFVFPSVMTVGLVAALVILNRFLVNLYAIALRADEETGIADALVPVLIGFALTLLSLPLLALFWGARTTDLLEIWAVMRDGFSIGNTKISVQDILTFVVVFVIGYMVTRLIQGALRGSVLPKTRMDTGAREAIVTGTGYLGIVLAALIAITTAGIDLSSLAIVAGALSVGIGFGLQTIVSNFVSGIILLIERPIKKGDWIEVGGIHGNVRDISVRSTRIETFDRSDVILPNADLIAGRVTNYTHANLAGRLIVPVGVAYGTDTRKVEKILKGVAENHPMVIMNPPPYVLFRGFGADSLDFEIRAILRDVNWVLNVHSDLNHEIAQRFAEEGIEIPFAQRDVWLRNPESLRTAPGAASGAPPEDHPEPALETPPEPEDGGDATGGET
ncbi:DUF3772 domain-containing protein [Rhodovulum sp. YNF3179]|uniref:DUF3772 domain-containing protein n=1 Tax=Rhodovulum sp. YNF3179 TaxID=3425127 RepID=UPI003D325007